MKILVVDDSKLARMAMARALGEARPDWTRIEAANADEAMTQVREASPDIAVFDFNMPGRDGLTLATEVRELRPSMPVAIISANHQQEIVDRARAIGAAFLSKPITAEAMQKFIETAESELKAGRL